MLVALDRAEHFSLRVHRLPDANLRVLRAVVVPRQITAMCAQGKTHLDGAPRTDELNREFHDRLT